jgi:hypothetical protein
MAVGIGAGADALSAETWDERNAGGEQRVSELLAGGLDDRQQPVESRCNLRRERVRPLGQHSERGPGVAPVRAGCEP